MVYKVFGSMKESIRLYKIRIVTREKNRVTYGVSLPASLASWCGTLVTVTESGNSIILESGTHPTPLKMKNMKTKTIEVINI